MGDPTMMILVTSGLAGAGILLMRDAVRSKRCPECAHCREQVRKEKEQQESLRHDLYHGWAGRLGDDCKDPKCPGRR